MMVDTTEEKRKFVILYENYRYLMLKVAVDILHDYQLAEDAVQEAFVRVAKHMENVGQPEETATKRYLITITKHAAIDLYRRRNRLQSREIYMDELPEETGQLTYMAPEEEHGVLDILKNLPPKYRDIFLLKYSAHLENREIARICGLREGTIRQRIARGKRLIEKELEKIKANPIRIIKKLPVNRKQPLPVNPTLSSKARKKKRRQTGVAYGRF